MGKLLLALPDSFLITIGVNNKMKYINIWSTSMRLTHWGMACATVFLLVSGFFKDIEGLDQPFWHDWHIIVGQILSILLVWRVALFFRPGSGHWQRFRITKARLSSMVDMLRFYLSFGQFPLPNWYAHNPIWLPVYVLMLLISLALVVTGFTLLYPESFNEVVSLRWHSIAAIVIGWASLAHVITAVMHDWKSPAAFISAMLSGSRYFETTDLEKQKSTFSIPVIKNSGDKK